MIRRDLSYMTYAPIVFISALTGQRVDRLFELINYVGEQASMRITTGMLNTVLADATDPGPAPHGQGPPPEDLLYDPGGHPPAPLRGASATMHGCSTSPISGIWKIRSAACSGWRVRPCIMSIRQKGEEGCIT